MFESIAKTNTTHTRKYFPDLKVLFESIAKTNTTHTEKLPKLDDFGFESIAKTNTTHTAGISRTILPCLRVLLKQIQHTQQE